MIVVDASLFAAWLLNEPDHGPRDAVWDILAAEAILVPDHWPNEVANALRRAVRTKRIRSDELAIIAERIGVFDISLAEAIRLDEIGPLATEALDHDLSTYDMIYLRLARDRHIALATADRAMRRAAARLNIPLLPATAP